MWGRQDVRITGEEGRSMLFDFKAWGRKLKGNRAVYDIKYRMGQDSSEGEGNDAGGTQEACIRW